MGAMSAGRLAIFSPWGEIEDDVLFGVDYGLRNSPTRVSWLIKTVL
jgi:hypothetical protein